MPACLAALPSQMPRPDCAQLRRDQRTSGWLHVAARRLQLLPQPPRNRDRSWEIARFLNSSEALYVLCLLKLGSAPIQLAATRGTSHAQKCSDQKPVYPCQLTLGITALILGFCVARPWPDTPSLRRSLKPLESNTTTRTVLRCRDRLIKFRLQFRGESHNAEPRSIIYRQDRSAASSLHCAD